MHLIPNRDLRTRLSPAVSEVSRSLWPHLHAESLNDRVCPKESEAESLCVFPNAELPVPPPSQVSTGLEALGPASLTRSPAPSRTGSSLPGGLLERSRQASCRRLVFWVPFLRCCISYSRGSRGLDCAALPAPSRTGGAGAC